MLCVIRRACNAHHLRKVEAESKAFRTEIERNEFLSVDWVDEYEAALVRKDLSGRTAMDHARANGHTAVVDALLIAEQRIAERRAHLDDLKRDAKISMCPLACGFRDRADAMPRHVRFTCRRRPVKCMYCPVIVKEEVLVEVTAPCFDSESGWLRDVTAV